LTKGKSNQKQVDSAEKIFPVTFASGEIKENISINTNSPSKPSKEQIINQAFKLHSQGNISEAAKYYQYCINQGFNDSRVFYNYGVILKNLGKLHEAEISLGKAIEIKPDFASAHLNLGNLFKELGKLQEAEISYRKAIKIKPDFASAYSNLGNLLRDFGQLQEAELSCQKAIELKPDFANPYYILGQILTDNEKLDEAEISFKKAIKLKFGFVQAHDALASIHKKLDRKEESEESSKKVIHLKPSINLNFESKKKEQNKLLKNPSPIEYSTYYRPGMGTENVGAFLRSMVMMLRPNRILEIGAGYTTPFLVEALINNERVFDDGNLSESYFQNYIYDPKLIIIDNQSLGELETVEGMEEIINSKYTDFVEGYFQEKGEELFKKYGHFDFVWFDCGGQKEYKNFIKEYWDYCSNYVFFHFTYSDGRPNSLHKTIRDLIKGNHAMFDIVEPHKKRQGSITMVQKKM